MSINNHPLQIYILTTTVQTLPRVYDFEDLNQRLTIKITKNHEMLKREYHYIQTFSVFFLPWRLLTDSEATFTAAVASFYHFPLWTCEVAEWPRSAPSVQTAEFSTSARYFVFVAALWCLILRRLFIRLSSSALCLRTCFAYDKRLGVSRASRQNSQRRRLSGWRPTAAAFSLQSRGIVEWINQWCFLKGSPVQFVMTPQKRFLFYWIRQSHQIRFTSITKLPLNSLKEKIPSVETHKFSEISEKSPPIEFCHCIESNSSGFVCRRSSLLICPASRVFSTERRGGAAL